MIASFYYLAMLSMQVQAREIVTHLRVFKFAKQLKKNKNIFFLSAFVQ